MSYSDRFQDIINYRFYNHQEPAVIESYEIEGKVITLTLVFINKPVHFDYSMPLSGFVPEVGNTVQYSRYNNTLSILN